MNQMVHQLMDQAARICLCEPLYHKMPPHITLHPLVVGIEGDEVESIVASVLPSSRITLVPGRLTMFGEKLLVATIAAQPLTLSRLWVALHESLRAAGHQAGEFEDDNTLHITLIDNLHRVVPGRRNRLLQELTLEPTSFTLTAIVIYQKTASDQPWREFKKFELPE
ncbi:MAG: hypothetical protein KBB55_01425 [Candidatus Buchananbacteria bacterium]|nr:hypothetical protein [Candidatus Buchananbacteria bacterium]